MTTDTRQLPETRWAWMQVDLGAIRRNARAFKDLTRPPTRFCAVVKANGYGHGAVEVAKACRAVGADMFAVATVDEGVQLRQGGIREPIVLLAQPPASSAPVLVANQIMPAAYELEFVARLAEEALSQGVCAKYHLAVDTGMDRIGVPVPDAAQFALVADRLKGVSMGGVFTHFATADKLADWDFALQFKRFREAVGAIRDLGVDPGVVHCANTPATVLHPETHLDMVRVGIGLYGLHPARTTVGRIELEQAMSIRARVTRVAHPQVGEGVGYGMTYRLTRSGTGIATLPVGYADGLARNLSNRMDVILGGRRLRQVGNICMDQCMVEVPAGVSVETGDEAVLMGAFQGESITCDEIAEKLGTINYEVACLFDNRLPKVFVR